MNGLAGGLGHGLCESVEMRFAGRIEWHRDVDVVELCRCHRGCFVWQCPRRIREGEIDDVLHPEIGQSGGVFPGETARGGKARVDTLPAGDVVRIGYFCCALTAACNSALASGFMER
ncbi:hypothetical protein GCM10011349_33510 [Novosphingobium indicum]|uniref:Alcohol dehydrogenase N-terminal domain-containing protein n=1 Tax=Novosphingobium indicum TaxID=462949 RepID=A0ABQ2JUT1_9SPHN|nr:hypothetical protein GCM10011349_33510 [Novosphingobium indicum]